MLHDSLSKLSDETLARSSASSLTSNLDVLEITAQDVVDCEIFVKRVGSQWEKMLRRRGYAEYADILVKLMDESSFLEKPSNNEFTLDAVEALDVDLDEEDTPRSEKFATIDAALNSIRRYEPDCDGSGNPSAHIPTLSDDAGRSSARRAIQQIDQIIESIDGDELKANYGYDWHAINQAVKRNEKRLYTFQRNEKDEYEIVPAPGGADEPDTEASQQEEFIRFDGSSQKKSIDADFIITNNAHTAKILQRKRKREEKLRTNDSGNIKVLKGRQPSTIGEIQWSWQDILNEIPCSRSEQLVRDYIHPPFPPEENDHSQTDDRTSAILCGALRPFGLTHLWEQTQHRLTDGTRSLLGSQKRTMRRAMKERVGPRTLIMVDKRSELGDEMENKKSKSKVKWTEDHGEALDNDDNQAFQWLEMDIGECVVERHERAGETSRKQMMAFRSLEVALRF